MIITGVLFEDKDATAVAVDVTCYLDRGDMWAGIMCYLIYGSGSVRKA